MRRKQGEGNDWRLSYFPLRLCVECFFFSLTLITLTLLFAHTLPPRTYAYTSDIDRDSDIFIHDLTSGARHAFPPDAFGATDRSPLWSPDGSRILYSSYQPTGEGFDIYIAHWSGANARRLELEPPTNAFNLSWSPDGLQIAFMRTMRREDYGCVLALDQADAHPMCFPIQPHSRAVWSPDSTRIAYTYSTIARNRDLYIVQLAPLTFQALTRTPDIREYAPQWSNDGQSLFYIEDGSGIFRYDLRLASQTQIYEIDYVRIYSVSPDNTAIALTNGDDLYVVSTDGTVRFRGVALYPFDLAWSADSAILAFTQATNSWDIAFLDMASGVVTRDVQPGNAQSPGWRR